MAAVYQTTVAPDGAVAVAVRVWIGLDSHSVLFPPLVGAVGAAFIVKVTAVRLVLSQPVVLFFEAA
ncbi:MAG: hypothetical protein ACK5NB_09445 [Flavobacteriaceae bacterium]